MILEILQIVEIFMIQPVRNSFEQGFEFMEINEQTGIIQSQSFDR